MILGHRGSAGSAPENTLLSFQRALDDGAHVLESDIQVTSDGVPILLHDSSVDRTTNGSGETAALSLKEIRALDASARFAPLVDTPLAPPAGPIRIPTLREAFEQFPDTHFNLEVKADSPTLLSEVTSLVAEMEREDRTLLTAGEDRIQESLRQELKRRGLQPALGASLADVLETIRSAQRGDAPLTDSMVLQIPRYFGNEPLVTPELVAHSHLHDIQIHVWTINDSEEITELLDLGVDGIVTDLPGRMAQLLAKRQTPS